MRKIKRFIALSAVTALATVYPCLPSYAAYEDYTEEEITKIEADITNYKDEIAVCGEQVGYLTDRFSFPNGKYSPVNSEEDLNWQEYFQSSTNIEAVTVNLEYFTGHARSGRCLGMSIASVLAHNGIISPSDIQGGKENLIDIEADTDFYGIKSDSVIKKIISYHTRQLAPDFQLDMYYHFAHYDKERDIKHLLDIAKKATEQGKWWLMGYDDVNLSHAVAGIGLVEGEFTIGNETYDNCILTYDSNFISEDSETGKLMSAEFCSAKACIFVNSKTYDVFVPAYFMDDCGEDFKIYTLDDYDFMNYNGIINPTDSYETDISSLNSVEIKSDGEYSITAERADGSEYDAKSSCGKTFNRNKKVTYLCDGEHFTVQNTGNATEFTADFLDTKQLYSSSFNGTVNNVFKSENEFGFNTFAETTYDITLAFEEGCYNFAPHYRYDFSGTTDDDFKAVQTDKGIIVSGKNGVKCSLKTSDVKRDENGLLISADDNIHNENIFTSDSVMISFDDNNLKFFIGENYDKEVQKGDVNCDGSIDASDASFVLATYAALSTGKEAFINNNLADYNNDGTINSSDASDILAKYAENSTS